MSATVIELQNVRKRFAAGDRSVTALDGLSAKVEAGRITGLVGPDGAGKTTLMRLLTGLLKPDSGSVRVLGLDAASQSQQIQASVGYMPQRFGLYEDLSVFQNLALINPMRYFLIVVRGTFLEGLPAVLVYDLLWPMALIATVSLAGAGWMFRHRLA